MWCNSGHSLFLVGVCEDSPSPVFFFVRCAYTPLSGLPRTADVPIALRHGLIQ